MYKYGEHLIDDDTPSSTCRGCVQRCPDRTAMPLWSRMVLRSVGWMPATLNVAKAPRGLSNDGPYTTSPSSMSARAAWSRAPSTLSYASTLSMPMSIMKSHARPSPMASAMAGVPASNLDGGAANVVFSSVTTSIISPPPIQGGMDSSASDVPHRKPIPVGPHILCAEPTIQSTPSVCTSIGTLAIDWQASSRTLASDFRAIRTTVSTGR